MKSSRSDSLSISFAACRSSCASLAKRRAEPVFESVRLARFARCGFPAAGPACVASSKQLIGPRVALDRQILGFAQLARHEKPLFVRSL